MTHEVAWLYNGAPALPLTGLHIPMLAIMLAVLLAIGGVAGTMRYMTHRATGTIGH
jgi:hypothetical protein